MGKRKLEGNELTMAKKTKISPYYKLENLIADSTGYDLFENYGQYEPKKYKKLKAKIRRLMK